MKVAPVLAAALALVHPLALAPTSAFSSVPAPRSSKLQLGALGARVEGNAFDDEEGCSGDGLAGGRSRRPSGLDGQRPKGAGRCTDNRAAKRGSLAATILGFATVQLHVAKALAVGALGLAGDADVATIQDMPQSTVDDQSSIPSIVAEKEIYALETAPDSAISASLPGNLLSADSVDTTTEPILAETTIKPAAPANVVTKEVVKPTVTGDGGKAEPAAPATVNTKEAAKPAAAGDEAKATEIELQVEKLQKEAAEMEKERSSLFAELTKARAEKDRAAAEQGKLLKERDQLREENGRLQREEEALRFELGQRAEILEAEVKKLEGEKAAAEARARVAAARIAKIEDQVLKLEQGSEDARERFRRLKDLAGTEDGGVKKIEGGRGAVEKRSNKSPEKLNTVGLVAGSAVTLVGAATLYGLLNKFSQDNGGEASSSPLNGNENAPSRGGFTPPSAQTSPPLQGQSSGFSPPMSQTGPPPLKGQAFGTAQQSSFGSPTPQSGQAFSQQGMQSGQAFSQQGMQSGQAFSQGTQQSAQKGSSFQSPFGQGSNGRASSQPFGKGGPATSPFGNDFMKGTAVKKESGSMGGGQTFGQPSGKGFGQPPDKDSPESGAGLSQVMAKEFGTLTDRGFGVATKGAETKQSGGTPAFSSGGSAFGAPTKGAETKQSGGTPAFSSGGSAFGAPTKGAEAKQQSGGTPAFGGSSFGAPAKGSAPRKQSGGTPAFGSSGFGTPTKGAETKKQSGGTPAFGGSGSGFGAPAKGAEAKQSGGTPAFRSSGFGTPTKGAETKKQSGGTPAFGGSGSGFGAPTKGAETKQQSGGTPAFGSSGFETPTKGTEAKQSGGTPAFGSPGSGFGAPTKGAETKQQSGGTPAFGSSGFETPTKGTEAKQSGGTPAFGSPGSSAKGLRDSMKAGSGFTSGTPSASTLGSSSAPKLFGSSFSKGTAPTASASESKALGGGSGFSPGMPPQKGVGSQSFGGPSKQPIGGAASGFPSSPSGKFANKASPSKGFMDSKKQPAAGGGGPGFTPGASSAPKGSGSVGSPEAFGKASLKGSLDNKQPGAPMKSAMKRDSFASTKGLGKAPIKGSTDKSQPGSVSASSKTTMKGGPSAGLMKGAGDTKQSGGFGGAPGMSGMKGMSPQGSVSASSKTTMKGGPSAGLMKGTSDAKQSGGFGGAPGMPGVKGGPTKAGPGGPGFGSAMKSPAKEGSPKGFDKTSSSGSINQAMLSAFDKGPGITSGPPSTPKGSFGKAVASFDRAPKGSASPPAGFGSGPGSAAPPSSFGKAPTKASSSMKGPFGKGAGSGPSTFAKKQPSTGMKGGRGRGPAAKGDAFGTPLKGSTSTQSQQPGGFAAGPGPANKQPSKGMKGGFGPGSGPAAAKGGDAFGKSPLKGSSSTRSQQPGGFAAGPGPATKEAGGFGGGPAVGQGMPSPKSFGGNRKQPGGTGASGPGSFGGPKSPGKGSTGGGFPPAGGIQSAFAKGPSKGSGGMDTGSAFTSNKSAFSAPPPKASSSAMSKSFGNASVDAKQPSGGTSGQYSFKGPQSSSSFDRQSSFDQEPLKGSDRMNAVSGYTSGMVQEGNSAATGFQQSNQQQGGGQGFSAPGGAFGGPMNGPGSGQSQGAGGPGSSTRSFRNDRVSSGSSSGWSPFSPEATGEEYYVDGMDEGYGFPPDLPPQGNPIDGPENYGRTFRNGP